MTGRRRLLAALASLAVLAAGGGTAAWLVATREEPPRQTGKPRAVLVETRTVAREETRLDVHVQGTVRAAREVVVQPLVQGRIVEVHPKLVPGGLVEAGEVLVTLDPADFRLAVERNAAALTEAEAQLAREQGRQDVAEAEWQAFEKGLSEVPRDRRLALRIPQREAAEAAVRTARANLEQARLDLERTRVRAPFDAVVRSRDADLGALVSPQAPVAELIGTERFWVRITVPVRLLEYVDVPGLNAGQGAPVTVRQPLGEASIERQGRILHLLGELDPNGRMARLLAEIPDPLGLEDGVDGRGLPLLADAFVDVAIAGNTRRPLVEIEREHLRGGDRVWVLGEDGRLQVREVEVVWRRPQTVLIGEGLEEGERLVTSRIGAAVDGMRLRTLEDGAGGG